MLYICNMKVKILQSIANRILDKAKNTKSDKEFTLYYDLALSFDRFCINYFDIYLN
jgi:hypothetical protein